MTRATVELGQTCSRPIECDALNPFLCLWFSKSVAPAGGQHQECGPCRLMRNANPYDSLQIKPSLSSGSAGLSGLITWLSTVPGANMWLSYGALGEATGPASLSFPSLGWNSRETHLLIYPSIRGEVRAVY